jgi:outer membrane protein TolC
LTQHLQQIDPVTLESVSTRTQTPAEVEPYQVDGPPPATIELSIEQCRAMVLQNNLDLQVELLSPTIAKQSISEEEARFESFFFGDTTYVKTDTPTATELVGSESKSIDSRLGVDLPLQTGGDLRFDLAARELETNNVFSTLNPSYDTDTAISITQNLLRGAGIWANTYPIRVAQYQYQQTSAQTRLAVIRVIANSDRVYWRLYAVRRLLEVRQAEYELAAAQLDKARRMVEVGELSEIEIVRAESGVAETLNAIIAADNAVRLEQRALKRILNAPQLPMSGSTAIIPVTPVNPVHYELQIERLINMAMEGRMELLELELQLAQDASTIGFEKNRALPLAVLDYTYNFNGLGSTYGNAFNMLSDRDFADYRLGLRVEIPLGNEAAKSRVRRAILNRLQSLSTKQLRQAQVTEEVLNSVDQLESNWQQILASRQAAVLAHRTYLAEQRQFEQGLRTSTDVLDAQARFSDAQANEVRALTQYQIAQIDLAFATGTVLGAAQIRWEPTGTDVTERHVVRDE